MQPETVFEQHAVPQNIASYQFKLVGEMTIKQFFQLAGGALVALLFYASPLPSFLKWPLVVTAALVGAALAFLPLEERPLEQWVTGFIRAIYSPTIFLWEKPATRPVFFKQEAASPPPKPPSLSPSAPDTSIPFLANLESTEKGFLSRISDLFSQHPSATPPAQPAAPSATPKAPVPVPKPKPISPPASAPAQPLRTAPVTAPRTPPPPAAKAVIFSPDAAPPTPPQKPNLVSGQVMDQAHKIVEGAILEIQDSLGRPVRALKTNKAGHFSIVTPLNPGSYTITIESPSLKFEPLKFEVQDQIIPPIAITATNATPSPNQPPPK